MRDVSSRRVVEVSPWDIIHGWHTQVNTSLDTLYYVFGFHNIINILCFQIYAYYKKNTGGLWPRFDPTMFREGFWPPMMFLKKWYNHWCKFLLLYIYFLYIYTYILMLYWDFKYIYIYIYISMCGRIVFAMLVWLTTSLSLTR